MATEFCCDNFYLHLTNAGWKGISIVPAAYKNTYRLFLHWRNRDITEEGSFSSGDIGISYCPWCGHNLEALIHIYKDEIAKFAGKNGHLIRLV